MTALWSSSSDDAKLDTDKAIIAEERAEFEAHHLIFYVNGKRVEERAVDPRTTLAVYLRDHLQLKGTKIGCNEGGCGACTVMLSDMDPLTDEIRHYSINSCLTPICAVFGKAVTTVEGIGGPQLARRRLHPVQERLAKTHGSQCGFCTPGFVMAMYSLLRRHPRPTREQIDVCLQGVFISCYYVSNGFSGNLCRCTGYRPILEAFYSFIPMENGTAKVVRGGGNNVLDGGCPMGTNCCQNRLKQSNESQSSCAFTKPAENKQINGFDWECGGLREEKNGSDSSPSLKRHRHEATTVGEKVVEGKSIDIVLEATDDISRRMQKFKLTTLEDCEPYDGAQEPIFPPELQLHKLHRATFSFEHNGVRWLQPTTLPHLLALRRRHPHARLISGNSELAVELKFRFIPLPIAINPKQIAELRQVKVDEACGGVYLGMGLSLNEIKEVLERLIEKYDEYKTRVFRSVVKILHYFAGNHVRNTASVAGNIATASPISDLNPVWMACGARIQLASEARGSRETLIDQRFFLGYRKAAIEADEILVGIWVPFTRRSQFFGAYKQAQRREDDIAIVTGAFFVEFEETPESSSPEALRLGRRKRPAVIGSEVGSSEAPMVKDLRIAYGGMAPTTKLADREKVIQPFLGRPWNAELLELAIGRVAAEFRLPANVPGGMSRFRQALTLAFLSKFFNEVNERLSGNDVDFLDELGIPSFQTTQIFEDVPAGQQPWDAVGRPLHHQSGEQHTTGEAEYSVDTKVFGCLHMAYVLSQHASGTLNSVDVDEALALDGVVGYVGAEDVPGSLFIGFARKTPIFAKDTILYHGQPIGGIVAIDHETARRGANLVRVDVSPCSHPIVSIEDAIEAQSFHWTPIRIHSTLADANVALNRRNRADYGANEETNGADPATCEAAVKRWRERNAAYKCVEGEIRIGGQEHFYLETQNCVVVPGERDELEVVSSTQCVDDVQNDVCTVMAVARHKVTVSVRRIGGGFGGKEICCGMFAAAAAVAASKFRRPVRLNLERFDDMALSGTRHPFRFNYRLAVDSVTGRFVDFNVDAYSNCGYEMDLSKGVMEMRLERCVTHLDNVYRFGNADFCGRLCRTNCASNTAFRGFGGPQGMFCTEAAIFHVAEAHGFDVNELRERNLYDEMDCTPFGMHLKQCNARRCWRECLTMSDFEARQRDQVAAFNRAHCYRKRGIAVTPTKFGIGFGLKRLNQAGALVHVYRDGSVLISHAGMEMGQGLHTKILQIASRCLRIDVSLIHIHNTATDKVPNASPTAASVGSDLNGLAVKDACETIMRRLEPFRTSVDGSLVDGSAELFRALVEAAYDARVSLSTTGFATIHSEAVDYLNGRGAELYGYCVYGAACTEVEVDCLTGDHRLLRSDIVMDIGDSLNPAVDIGQIEGAFVQFSQGYGLFTMEELRVRPSGVRLTRGPSNYKIPSADDAPRQFHVKLLKGSSNWRGIFSSKAVGEPPLFLGASALFAIRDAIRAYRAENNHHGYFRLDSPATPERIRLACSDHLLEKLPPEEPIDRDQRWTVDL